MIGPGLRASGGCSAVGVDIGARSIKAVQVRRRGGAAVLTAAAEFARMGPAGAVVSEEEAARIEAVLYRRGFSGQRVTVAAPRAGLFWSEVERPPRGKGVPEGQIVRAELARAQRVEPGSFEQVWWDVPQDGRRGAGGSVMAVGCDRAPLTGLIERFDVLGVEVSAVDLPMPALLRGAKAAGLVSEPFSILADLGWSAASIGVVFRGVVVYERQVPSAGTGPLVHRVMEALGVERDVAEHLLAVPPAADVGGACQRMVRLVGSHAQVIAEEVEASLQYAAHRFRSGAEGRVVLCGGGGEIEAVRVRCERIPGCETRVLRPGAMVRLPDEGVSSFITDRAGFALATSLAMRFDR